MQGVSDYDWSELARDSGLNIHPDSLRKMGAGIRLAADVGALSIDGIESISAAADSKELQKLRDLRREINEAARMETRSEALRETVAHCVSSLGPIVVEPAMCLCDPANRSLVVCVADCHYGAEWRITGLRDEVVNEYSPDIFEKRMINLLDQIQSIMDKEDVWNVTLLLCGDSLDGMLRQSQ